VLRHATINQRCVKGGSSSDEAAAATGSGSNEHWCRRAAAKGIGGNGHWQGRSCNSTMRSGKVAEEGDGGKLDDRSGALLDNAGRRKNERVSAMAMARRD
jgi:hypothetical protein